jgi:hypothetical protein
MRKFILGSVAAAAVGFIVGIAWWQLPIAMPLLTKSTERPHDTTSVAPALLAQFQTSGTYLIPDPSLGRKECLERVKTGPLATVHIHREGIVPYAPGGMALGALLTLAFSVLIAALLQVALPRLDSYWRRVGFVTLAGLASGFYWLLNDTVGSGGSWAFFCLTLVLGIAHWCIIGLVLAAFIKPRAPADPSSAMTSSAS